MKWYSITLKDEELAFLTKQLECDKDCIGDALQISENEEDKKLFEKHYELCNGVLDACYNYKKLIKEE